MSNLSEETLLREQETRQNEQLLQINESIYNIPIDRRAISTLALKDSDWNLLQDGTALMLPDKKCKLIANSPADLEIVLKEILKQANSSNRFSWKDLTIHRAFPMSPLKGTPFIVLKFLGGGPGVWGPGSNATSRKMINFQLFGTTTTPEDHSSEIFIFRQKFEYKAEISIYADTATEADNIKERIFNILELYKWYVIFSGIKEFSFTHELADTVESEKHKRSLVYEFSFFKYKWVSYPTLKEIIYETSL